jgi:hypothetical protein
MRERSDGPGHRRCSRNECVPVGLKLGAGGALHNGTEKSRVKLC